MGEATGPDAADSGTSARLWPAAAVAAVATAVMLLVARRGVYLSPDGMHYVGTARNLLDGDWAAPPGSTPLGNFPPLFSLVLAGIGLLGPDPLTVAQWGNPFVAGACVFVAGVVVRRSGGSWPQALAAQALVFTASEFLSFSTSALSEPLFVLLVLLTVAALRDDRLRLAPALAAAACLTRYVGVAVVGAGVAYLLLCGRGLRRAGAFAAAALGPLAVWIAGIAVAGEGGGRRFAVHLPDAGYFRQGLRVASTWVVPEDLMDWPERGWVAAVAVAALAAVALMTWRRGANGVRASGTVRLLGLFAAAYLAVLLLQRSFAEITGRLDARFLLVLHVSAAVAVAASAVGRRRGVHAALWLVVLLHAPPAVEWVTTGARVDRPSSYDGYAASLWRDSAVLRAIPANEPVTSNRPDVVYFHTGRVAQRLSEPTDFYTGEPNREHDASLAATRGYVAYFTATVGGRPREMAAPHPGWVEVVRDRTGVLYRVAGGA